MPKPRRANKSARSKGGKRWPYVVAALVLIGGFIWFIEHRSQPAQRAAKPAPERSTPTKPRPQVPSSRPALPSQETPAEIPIIVAPKIVLGDDSPQPAGGTTPHAASVAPARLSQPYAIQLALDRLGFSSGSLDGRLGGQTRLALNAYRAAQGLGPGTTLPDTPEVRDALDRPDETEWVVTEEDIASLRPAAETWQAKAVLDRLGHVTLLERIAEFSHAHPELIRKLNPGVPVENARPGDRIRVPDTKRLAPPSSTASMVRISLGKKTLEVLDTESRVVFHCPVSIAKKVEKRPKGVLRIANWSDKPNYTFDPAVFPESPEAQALGRKLIIPPGPNNPVGVVWIGLDLPGYGMHGTPVPEQVGRTESHGCFRLANWNAAQLLKLIRTGMEVVVVD